MVDVIGRKSYVSLDFNTAEHGALRDSGGIKGGSNSSAAQLSLPFTPNFPPNLDPEPETRAISTWAFCFPSCRFPLKDGATIHPTWSICCASTQKLGKTGRVHKENAVSALVVDMLFITNGFHTRLTFPWPQCNIRPRRTRQPPYTFGKMDHRPWMIDPRHWTWCLI